MNNLPQVSDIQTNAMAYYKTNYRYTSLQHLEKSTAAKSASMRGVKRVFAFCCLAAVLPALLIICPLYLKHQVFRALVYNVTESDILEVRDGISTIFCQEHQLKMDTSFNAFQLNHMPDQSKSRKHIRLRKSMVLPDDTLEYWGFYLMKGATVELKVCSRFDGSRILVVKGERNLKTCGLMDHNKEKFGAGYYPEQSQVQITFETAAEIVYSGEAKNNLKSRFNDDHSENHGGENFDEFNDEPKKEFNSNYLKIDENELQTDTDGSDAVSDEKNNRHKVQSKHDEDDKKARRRRSHKHNDHRETVHHHHRPKRDTILDRGIAHGGNAPNFVPQNESESISSFENALLECYDGNILVAKDFPSSRTCLNVTTLEQGKHMVSKHDVLSDGYYYYIFYSDNDFESNHIHAVFDIYKPTYLYSNISETKGCINSTTCRFPIQMFSDEVVIVEVPTRDGIEHEDDDVTQLYSQCVPRMAVYVIFPIAVLVFILGFAFI